MSKLDYIPDYMMTKEDLMQRLKTNKELSILNPDFLSSSSSESYEEICIIESIDFLDLYPIKSKKVYNWLIENIELLYINNEIKEKYFLPHIMERVLEVENVFTIKNTKGISQYMEIFYNWSYVFKEKYNIDIIIEIDKYILEFIQLKLI